MADYEAGRVVVRLEGKDLGLSQLIDAVTKKMNIGVRAAKEYDRSIQDSTRSRAADDRATLAHAKAISQYARYSGDAKGAVIELAAGVQRLKPGTTTAAQGMAALQQEVNRFHNSVQSGRAVLTNFAAGFNKLIGAAFAAQAALQAIAVPVQLANQAEKIDATFRALSGTTEQYKENLSVAKKQQDLFGGSLAENQENLSGFIYTARTAGVSVEQLSNVARKLAIIDPAQGFKGASIALKELFSGEITSLSRRFELPRSMLNDINKLGTGAEKIAALNQQLAQMGITEELLTSQARTTAVEFDKLRGQLLDFATQGGNALITILLPALQQIQVGFTNLFGNTENLAYVTNAKDKYAALTAAFLTASPTVEVFNAKITEANAKLNEGGFLAQVFAAEFTQATPATFAFAQALQAAKTPIEEIGAKLQENQTVIKTTEDAYRSMAANNSVFQATSANLDAFSAALGKLAATGPEGMAAIQTLGTEFTTFGPTVDITTQKILAYVTELQNKAAQEASSATATNQVTQATQLFTQELAANAVEAAGAQIQSEALKLAQEQMYNVALAAANGVITSAEALRILTGELGVADVAAKNLINTLAQLAQVKALKELGFDFAPGSWQQKALGPTAVYVNSVKQAHIEQLKFAQSIGNTKQKLAAAQAELSATTRGTQAYRDALGKVRQYEEQLERESKKKKGGGGTKLSDAEKVNNQLLAQQDKFNDKYEDAEQKHVDNLSKIYEDYYTKLKEQQDKNEISKRRSKYDFYSENADLPEGLDPAKYAAQYEEAFQRAQQIAQEGNAALAQEYLEMRQKQIEEMRKLDEEAAKIQADENLSQKEKEAALAYLEGRRKLLADAQAEELKQLQEHGDAINNELKQRLEEEAKAYEDQTGRIAVAADRKAEAIINGAERARKKLSEENIALAEQLGLVEKIADKANSVGNRAGSAGGTAGSVPANTPAQTVEGILVRQSDIWRVIDQDTINAIGDLGARIEGKLDSVIGAIDNARSSITGAIGRIKVGSQSVVQ